MKRRTYLQDSVLLTTGRGLERIVRRFTIHKRLIKEGSSAVCYEAEHESSGRGVLKEFYPRDFPELERDYQGQLMLCHGDPSRLRQLEQARDNYCKPYTLLLTMKKSSEYQDFSGFIPYFEIYRGCSEDGNPVGTVYIWTPSPAAVPFERLCSTIREQPERYPQSQLFTVLLAIQSLAECVCRLHTANLIHRDLTPENFGFIVRGSEMMPQSLCLFDINSVCSGTYGQITETMATPGYCEPETGIFPPSCQTDLYSIGCILYHALAIFPEEAGGAYRDEDYDNLQNLLSESRLLRACECNSYPNFTSIMLKILRRCLAQRPYRYQCCEELLDDLKQAIYYAGPPCPPGEEAGKRWVLADLEQLRNFAEPNPEKNSAATISYHLFRHPIYEHLRPGEKELNILVLGFGNYGQKFVDAVLQAGQIQAGKLQGLHLNVTVATNRPEDRQVYLEARPALGDFFSIDGGAVQAEIPYGSIWFENRSLNPRCPDQELSILLEHYDRKKPCYVFIALGRDEFNYETAKICKSAVDEFEMNCTVSYAWDQSGEPEPIEGVCPVLFSADIRKDSNYDQIERMAFNTHLIWEKDLNLDYSTLRARFRNRYNRSSSISNVLSIKYKLFSMGIRLETMDFAQAAQIYQQRLREGNTREELCWIEHRRWVTEKVCGGWKQLRNLEDCAGSPGRRQKNKDSRRKLHICITDSRPDQLLKNKFTSNADVSAWDRAGEKELSQLDPLDRLSVDLHRVYMEKAERARTRLQSDKTLDVIRSLVCDDRRALGAFLEWQACLQNILNGNRSAVLLYENRRQTFLQAAERLTGEVQRAAAGQVKAFEVLFNPILDSMAYTDWKQIDVNLIDAIPFILTYSENSCLAVPFRWGSVTDIFDNVAAAMVVSPSRLLLLCLLEEDEDIRGLCRAVPRVSAIMKRKNMKAAVDCVLVCPESLADRIGTGFYQKLRDLSDGRFYSFKRICGQKTEDAVKALIPYLHERQKGKAFFALEQNKSPLSRLLQGARAFDEFPCYEFTASMPGKMAGREKFRNIRGCESLNYIRKIPRLTAGDLAVFQNSAEQKLEVPEFLQDYEQFWDRYTADTGTWKRLCSLLSEAARENDLLAALRKKNQRDKTLDTGRYVYLLPAACRKTALRIVQMLVRESILEEGSQVTTYSSDICQVDLMDRCGYRTIYNQLFSRVYALMQDEAVQIALDIYTHEVQIFFDDLTIRNVHLPKEHDRKLWSLLEFFQNKGYLLCLQSDPQGVSFTCCCRRVKELITTGGKMLELYTYHKARSMGYFDDVVSSMEVCWESSSSNEFDSILTKGFRTLVVECKARPHLEQNFYIRLSQLAARIGIHATPVLVADTQEKEYYDMAAFNDIMRKDGAEYGVITVWKPEDIKNIGKTLKKIMEGTYESEEK